jgi:hypothetical protein
VPYVVPLAESRQYDGTDPEGVAEWVGARFVSVDSNTGRLVFEVSANFLVYEMHADPGWWVIRQNGACGGTHSPEDYARIWHELPIT